MATQLSIPASDGSHVPEAESHDDLFLPTDFQEQESATVASVPQPAARSQTGQFDLKAILREIDDPQVNHQDAHRAKDETQTARATHPRLLDIVGDKTIRALIVEDTVELAEVIQATLESMGLVADFATQGKAGLKQAMSTLPELLLIDIGLPDMTGWKMLEDVKAHYEAHAMPLPMVIIITAYGDPANRLIGKLQDIHSYLIKPFTPAQVEKTVRIALYGQQSA